MHILLNSNNKKTIDTMAKVNYRWFQNATNIYFYKVFDLEINMFFKKYQLYVLDNPSAFKIFNLSEEIAIFISKEFRRYTSITEFYIFATPFKLKYNKVNINEQNEDHYLYLFTKRGTDIYYVASSEQDYQYIIHDGILKIYSENFYNKQYNEAQNQLKLSIPLVNSMFEFLYSHVDNALKAKQLLSNLL